MARAEPIRSGQTATKALLASCHVRSDWDVPREPLLDALLMAQGQLGEGIAIVDREASRFLLVNDALCRLYGYSPEELLELQDYLSIVEPDDLRELAARRPEPDERVHLRVVR